MKVKKSTTHPAPKYPSHRQLSDFKTLAGIAAIGLSAMTALGDPSRTGGVPVRTKGKMPITPRQAETNIPPPKLEGDPRPPGGMRPTDRAITNSISTVSYTVKEGDTLSAIAARQLGDATLWQEIVKLNPGLKADSIKPGQTIIIPAKAPSPRITVKGSYRVQKETP
jgi:nucleoid-associated protein YgaU